MRCVLVLCERVQAVFLKICGQAFSLLCSSLLHPSHRRACQFEIVTNMSINLCLLFCLGLMVTILSWSPANEPL